MSANQACFPVASMARVLGVSKAGFHAWLKRPPSAHAEAATCTELALDEIATLCGFLSAKSIGSRANGALNIIQLLEERQLDQFDAVLAKICAECSLKEYKQHLEDTRK